MTRARSHPLRRSLVVAALTVGVLPSHGVAATCWRPPVEAPVADPFRSPACRWCPGNRGIEYATVAGERVAAVAGGVVAFAGAVAGVRYVVVRHPDGLRATYGRLADTHLSVGDRVVAGAVIGSTSAPRFHFGLRDGDEYVDPTPLLGVVVRRARLIPVDGTPPNPGPPPTVRCERVPGSQASHRADGADIVSDRLAVRRAVRPDPAAHLPSRSLRRLG